jgi:DNA repair exonuclease SbcCD ATPase subunit
MLVATSKLSRDDIQDIGSVNRCDQSIELASIGSRLKRYIDAVKACHLHELEHVKNSHREQIETFTKEKQSEIEELQKKLYLSVTKRKTICEELEKYKKKLLVEEEELTNNKKAMESSVLSLHREIEVKNQKEAKLKESLEESLTKYKNIENELQTCTKERCVLKNEVIRLQKVTEEFSKEVVCLKEDQKLKNKENMELRSRLEKANSEKERELDELRNNMCSLQCAEVEKVKREMAIEYNARLEKALLEAKEISTKDLKDIRENLAKKHEEELDLLRKKLSTNESLFKESTEKLNLVSETNECLRKEIQSQLIENEKKEKEFEVVKKALIEEKKWYTELQKDYDALVKENEAYKRLLADVEHNNEILTEELDYTMKMIEQEERRMGITLTDARTDEPNYKRKVLEVLPIGNMQQNLCEVSQLPPLKANIVQRSPLVTLEKIDLFGKRIILRNVSKKSVRLKHWKLQTRSPSSVNDEFMFQDVLVSANGRIAVYINEKDNSRLNNYQQKYSLVFNWQSTTAWICEKGSLLLLQDNEVVSRANFECSSSLKRMKSFFFRS